MELGFSETQAFSKEDKVLIVRLARKYALAIDRARLYDAERLARRQAEQIEERLAFLAQINTALTTVRGYESQLESVARCIVPYLADWCLIDVLEKNDSIFSAADAATDSTKQALLAEMHRRYPPNLTSPEPVAEVLRTGAPKCYPEMTDALLVMVASDDNHLALLRRLGCSSMLIVPLVARGRILGALTLVAAESKRRYTAEDLTLAEELGRRAGLAVDNVRLYDEVQAQREHLQVTLASIGDAVIATDRQGHITFMNAAAESLTGWKFDDTAETYLNEVFRIINETTREPQEDPVLKVLRENAVVALANHTLLIAKDGTEIPIDDSGAPIRDESGAIIGMILVFRDIAERRHRETALDATLQRTQDLYETCRQIGLVSSPEEVVQALLTSRYLGHATRCAVLTFNTLWNDERPASYEVAAVFPAGAPLPGFAADDSLSRGPLANLLSSTNPVFIEEAHTDTRLDREARKLFTQTDIHSLMLFPLTAGRRCFGLLLFYFASPQHWSQEDYRHIQVFVDQVCVTLDNVRLFAAEAQARLEAERANAVKLRFLAMISHELRTPLTAIKGFATTLLATDVTWDAGEQRDFITIINEEADKLTDLISQLLDLSRLQAGKLRIQPESRSLGEIIDAAMAQLESLALRHRLVINIAPDLPPVRVDTQRIAEVLVNLVGNAVKYAPPATAITISAATHEADLQVNVSDEGPGIPLENRERVFEAFLQLENSLHQQGNGLGLGLAICKGLIEAHGGMIWVADTSSGTTMSFTLPMVRA
jgi:PAS domain S-box-containing protein